MPGLKYPIPHVPMLGKGSILLDIFDAAGLPTGLRHLGNCTKFELDLKDDIAELYQSLNKNVSLIATALKKRQPKIVITGTDFSSDHMAIANMSSGKTSLAIAVGTVTAETLVSATAAPNAKGRYFRTATPNYDPTGTPPVLTQNLITLVAGTDYTLADPVTGLIYFPLTSSIDATHAITITYHTLLGNFDQVAGATVPFVQGHLVFVPDPVDGQKIGCDIWRVNLNPNGQIGLIADDYGNWTLDGNILDDTANHPLSPYYLYTFF
ncbi:MAG: hypothetical protein LAN84_00245 [Acidobacteriia bacterium]|nr:hypothetical protein [Terriglobia bacterium]